jgi:hypothetical protein
MWFGERAEKKKTIRVNPYRRITEISVHFQPLRRRSAFRALFTKDERSRDHLPSTSCWNFPSFLFPAFGEETGKALGCPCKSGMRSEKKKSSRSHLCLTAENKVEKCFFVKWPTSELLIVNSRKLRIYFYHRNTKREKRTIDYLVFLPVPSCHDNPGGGAVNISCCLTLSFSAPSRVGNGTRHDFRAYSSGSSSPLYKNKM